jgi:hypothetical protein
MDTHFCNSIADRFTVAEIALFSRPDAVNDASATNLVFQGGEPRVEFLCRKKVFT